MIFVPQAWLGDPQIQGLSFEHQGVLLRLYAIAGQSRTLSNDPIKLCRQLGVTRPKVKGYLAALAAFYLRKDEVVIELRPLDALQSQETKK